MTPERAVQVDDASVATPTHARVLMLGTDPDMRGGVASVVSTLREAGLFERCRVTYVATHVDGGRFRKLLKFARAFALAVRTMSSGSIALVHAHVSANGSFWRKALLLAIARQLGIPTVFHLHDGRFNEFARTGFGGSVLRWCIRQTLERSDSVIVLSARWSKWAKEFAPRSRVRIIGNPVQCPVNLVRPHESDDAAADRRILFLGKICEEKGAFDLLDAFEAFQATHPRWRLVLGGNGEIGKFQQSTASVGLADRVECLGWVSGSQKDLELSRADVFVLPSYGEGMPVSLLEAMAYRTAVIATPVGGVPDMMTPEVHGLWIEPGDVKGLAVALSRLAESPELRSRLGHAARSHVLEQFSTERVVSQVCEVYAEVARARGR